MDLHIARLTNAERAIRRLILDGWVPPAIEVEHVVGSGEIEPGPARLERQDEDGRPVGVVLELGDEAVALGHRRAAVQEKHLSIECLAEKVLEQATHLGVLREH